MRSKNFSASIIIRACDEEKYIGACINAINNQKCSIPFEVLVIDSGSIDGTVDVSKSLGARIINIRREDFSFGYALNEGIRNANNKIIISISAHCLPINENWLENLISPIYSGCADLTFGSQISDPNARCSEFNYFKNKYHPENILSLPLEKSFNNANSAFLKNYWDKVKFDENIKAQEDIFFANNVTALGGKIKYINTAKVVHYHNFTNKQLFKRIYIDTKFNKFLGVYDDKKVRLYRHFIYGVCVDIRLAFKRNVPLKALPGIILFRSIELLATYKALL
jgi:glycosyltransferase involved in cell wall biosynthesis